MKDMVEQIYDELNAQVVRMMEHGRKQAERIAELEAQIAGASAPAVDSDKVICANLGELLLTQAKRKAADTDKLREAIKAANDLISRWGSFAWSTPESGPYVYALKDAISELRSTALQAPVREVPEPEGWREAMQEFVDRCERGEILSRYTYSKFKALLAPLPAAPVQQEGE